MKKYCFSMFFCMLFLLAASEAFPRGRGTAMGDLRSVVSTGPFDTVRNPALLISQTAENAFGFFCSYSAYFPVDDSFNNVLNTENKATSTYLDFECETDQEKQDITGMSAQMANSTRIGDVVLGFALTDVDNSQLTLSEKEVSSYNVAVDSFSNFVEIKRSETSKTTEINPGFATALAGSISDTSSIGMQVLVKYYGKEEEREITEKHVVNSITEQSVYEKREHEIRKISAELGFGYLYSKDDIQAGLLVRTGDYSWIEKSLKIQIHTESIATPPPDADASGKGRIKGAYTSGPGITAGGYTRINRYFGLALESSFRFDNVYTDKDLDYKADTDEFIEREFITEMRNAVSFRAGIEYNPMDGLAFMWGTGYSTGTFCSYSREYSTDMENYSFVENRQQFYYATLGADYAVSQMTSLNFLIAMIYYIYDTDSFAYSNNVDMRFYSRSDSRIEGSILQGGFGITLSF